MWLIKAFAAVLLALTLGTALAAPSEFCPGGPQRGFVSDVAAPDQGVSNGVEAILDGAPVRVYPSGDGVLIQAGEVIVHAYPPACDGSQNCFVGGSIEQNGLKFAVRMRR